MITLSHLLCPIDQTELDKQQNSLVCAQGHTFDIAKSGYVNLLPVHHKHSKDPGDSKEMVASRQQFLNVGFYAPIIDSILQSLPPDLAKQTLQFFDAGCGEGYYTQQLQQRLQQQGQPIAAIGLDISKWAVLAASKRSKEIGWIVGSNAHVPAPAGRFDWVMCAFGFPVFEEFQRILAPNGYLLLVEAGADHLIELRQILYPEIKPYRPTYADGVAGFELVHDEAKQFRFTLSSQLLIAQLLSMTPHIHKAPYAGRQAVQKLNEIELTADIRLRWYRNVKEANNVE